MSAHNPRDPISLKVTYNDINDLTIETTYRSLHEASKALSINLATLKGLSIGKTPKLPENAPKNLKVVQIPTVPKPTNLVNGKYYCEICDKYIQPKSKYDHIMTKSHLKIKKILEKQQESTQTTTITH